MHEKLLYILGMPLTPFQKSNLKIARPGEKQTGFNRIAPENKPNIVKAFESIIPDQKIRRSGRAMLACCPFHGENNPSFAMYEDTNSFYCFTCEAKGDSFDFIMEQMNCDFLAAKQYAEENNLYEL
jgi:hypothetical protein